MTDIYTARVSYSGSDRLDITRKSAGPDGLPFAPSWRILKPMLRLRRAAALSESRSQGISAAATAYAWPQYVEDYTAEMRASYRDHRAAWDRILARDEVTLVCYCVDPLRCHRTLLAEILAKLGAVPRGERPS